MLFQYSQNHIITSLYSYIKSRNNLYNIYILYNKLLTLLKKQVFSKKIMIKPIKIILGLII